MPGLADARRPALAFWEGLLSYGHRRSALRCKHSFGHYATHVEAAAGHGQYTKYHAHVDMADFALGITCRSRDITGARRATAPRFIHGNIAIIGQ